MKQKRCDYKWRKENMVRKRSWSDHNCITHFFCYITSNFLISQANKQLHLNWLLSCNCFTTYEQMFRVQWTTVGLMMIHCVEFNELVFSAMNIFVQVKVELCKVQWTDVLNSMNTCVEFMNSVLKSINENQCCVKWTPLLS